MPSSPDGEDLFWTSHQPQRVLENFNFLRTCGNHHKNFSLGYEKIIVTDQLHLRGLVPLIMVFEIP